MRLRGGAVVGCAGAARSNPLPPGPRQSISRASITNAAGSQRRPLLLCRTCRRGEQAGTAEEAGATLERA
jgi:hypothetical protein